MQLCTALCVCFGDVPSPAAGRYRSINTESAAFRGKLQSLVGPATLLKALGFEKNEEDGKLKFDG